MEYPQRDKEHSIDRHLKLVNERKIFLKYLVGFIRKAKVYLSSFMPSL